MHLDTLPAELDRPEAWPPLPLDAWRETRDTLHLWSQIVGKVRMVLSPRVNHWWNAAFYVSAHGLTTSLIPYEERGFEIEFDFVHHNLRIRDTEGNEKALPLIPRSVADFYEELMGSLEALDLQVSITARPDELPDPIPFEQDQLHAAYDPIYVARFWRLLRSADAVLKVFRSGFQGKCSPVHFFWGSFDLAVSRFSGQPAPVRPGADAITREAYSHSTISTGLWTGGGPLDGPAFYSYTAPEPQGLSSRRIQPASGYYSAELKEFLLRYDDLRRYRSPTQALLSFCESTYEAGAELSDWDRGALEREFTWADRHIHSPSPNAQLERRDEDAPIGGAEAAATLH